MISVNGRRVISRSTQFPAEYRLLTREEVKARLQKMKLARGHKAPQGDTITVYTIGKYLNISRYSIVQATNGIMNDDTLIILSRFFTLYDDGRIKFIKTDKGDWKVEYPENPVPRIQRPMYTINRGQSGLSLQFNISNTEA